MMAGTKTSEVPVTAKGQAVQLRSAIEGLQAQRGTLDRKRNEQLAGVRDLQARRGHLVAQLAGADVKVAGQLHMQVNSIDRDIVAAQRVAESLETNIAKADREIDELSVQLHDASETARREDEAREDEASEARLAAIEARGEKLSDDISEWLAEFNAAAGAHGGRGPLQSNKAHELQEKFMVRHRTRAGMLNWRPQWAGTQPAIGELVIKPMAAPAKKS
ncbi:MAG: hypothetical protein WA647_19100 [Candidatus Acidiferrum sp.]